MGALSWLRLGGGLLGLIAMAGVAWLAKDRFVQKARADDAAACDVAAEGVQIGLDLCLPHVRARVDAARRGAACEASLLPSLRPESRFAMQQACGPGVRRVVAAMDVAEATRAGLADQLAQAQALTGRAVARAERRSQDQAGREKHVHDTLAGAPRGADGSIGCDAGCLQRLGR